MQTGLIIQLQAMCFYVLNKHVYYTIIFYLFITELFLTKRTPI